MDGDGRRAHSWSGFRPMHSGAQITPLPLSGRFVTSTNLVRQGATAWQVILDCGKQGRLLDSVRGFLGGHRNFRQWVTLL
jgi:hypothetical protein